MTPEHREDSNPSATLSDAGIRLLARFGDMVISWNECEMFARVVANEAAGGSTQTFALVSGLNAAGLANMLRFLATVGENTTTYRAHLRHSAELFDALRTYRNHYVHGLHSVVDLGKTAKATVMSTQLKGSKLRSETDLVDENQLIELGRRCKGASKYLHAVAHAFDKKGSETGLIAADRLVMPEIPPQRPTMHSFDWSTVGSASAITASSG